MMISQLRLRFMNLTFSLGLTLFSFNMLSAQLSAHAIQWQATLGGTDLEDLGAVYPTPDGGVIVATNSMSSISGNKTEANVGDVDLWIVKLNSVGAIEWQNVIGANNFDAAFSIKPTSDGGYIVGGYSQSGISGDKTEANRGVGGFSNGDYWIVKLSSNGTIQWDKTFGGSGEDYLVNIEEITGGGYIVGGYSDSPISGEKTQASQGGVDFWLVKLDATGTKIWDKTIGFNGIEVLTSVKQTIDGGFILGGSVSICTNNGKTNYGAWDYWVVKTDANGDIQWHQTYGGSHDDYLESVRQNPTDGSFILGGRSESPISGLKTEGFMGGYYDLWVLKTDVSGNIIWQNTIGGTGYEYLTVAHTTADGGSLVAALSSSPASADKTTGNYGGTDDFWVLKLNNLGAIEWQKVIGGTGQEILYSAEKDANEALILMGVSGSNISGDKTTNEIGGGDMWVVKLGQPVTSTTPSVSDLFLCQNAPTSPLTATGQNLLWYTVSTGGIGNPIAPTPSSAVAGVTSYYVSQTINGIESARVEIKVTVDALPVTTISGNSTMCSGTFTTLTATGNYYFLWNTGSSFQSTTVSPTSTTTYTVTATNGNGCSNTASKTVSVTPINAAITAPNRVCRGTAATLTASGGGTYLWSTGHMASSITQAPQNTTTYRVTVTNNGCTKIATHTLTVDVLNSVQIVGLNTQYAQNAAPVTLIGTPAGGVFTIDNIPATVLNPATLSLGNHAVRYTVTQGACTAFNGKRVTIVGGSSNLRISQNTGSGLSSTSNNQKVAQLYPNPTSEFINLDLENFIGKAVAITIYNQIGQNVLSQKMDEVLDVNQQINVSKFQSGNYVLRLTSENENDVVLKFVVNK
jgi:Secretion system C-terminal sorting domain